ncbi:S-layer homology domain-containing protein [Paenibacillus alba]|uniref:S-layer homology domain-containing protein n=1 Tax=Paenibacillus alba TaxID=1197127 RepID=UPI00156781A3|nr:S-layer homology domain-containing protein [Paenibacillus alba]NQX65244.1 S-layer homology domain-containing protein [Paenibacillus alba]
MLKWKRLLLIWMAILLMLPFQNGAALAVDAPAVNDTGAQGASGAAFVKIKNKWQSNYLYEDAAGVIRYGFTSMSDQTAHWVIEDVPGNSSFKRIKNRSTGHFIVMGTSVARRDALRSAAVSVSTAADQWQFRNGTGENFITIRSVTDLAQDFFIHEEDQLGFAQVSSDINAAFDSPQWQLEAVSDEVPVRISNLFREGQYLYEDKLTNEVKFAKLPMDDISTYWVIEHIQDGGSGVPIVRLRNQQSGHYITQGTLWAPIKSLPMAATTKNQWLMAAGTSDGWLTFSNVYAKGTDRIPGDPDEIDAGSQIYVLNTQFEDTSARSNNWSVLDRANAQWRIELVSELKPVRIANYTSEAVSDKYLYEEQGLVKYGAIASGSVTTAVYQWVVEDYNGKKRLRNVGTGHYMTEPNQAQPAAPLLSTSLNSGSTAGQWSIANSKTYDDYVTVQSTVYGNAYIHTSNQLGFAQSSLVSPDADAAQWLFEDPSVIAGVEQFVQITNAWNSLALIEDADSNLKYGNVKEDDQRAQWVIEKFAGRKRIKNRATGHYINTENPVNGHLRVTPVEDSWRSAVWVIETINGNTKQIHSSNDANTDPNHQKFINVQNLIKYAEYSEIPSSWQSKNWRFVPVAAGVPKPIRFKNKATNLYLYENADHVLKYGDKPDSDLSSLWFLNTSQNDANYKYLINVQSGSGVTLENVVPHIEQDSPPDSLITYPTIDVNWKSANWIIEDANIPGYVKLKSGWTQAHYMYADVSQQDFKVSKLKGNDDSALFAMEIVTLPPNLPNGQKRIKNVDNGQYLYENSRGIVMYGSPAANDGYSHWIIESDNGVQRFKNAATGHYMSTNSAYEFISYSQAPDFQSSQWVIEDIAGAGKYWIRSYQADFNDEYLNVVNNAGYPERGLYARSAGGNEKKLQWTFEEAVLPLVKPDLTEQRYTDTGTPIIEDTGYIQLINKATQEAVQEVNGQVSTAALPNNSPSAQWIVQDFNGHKLIKNRASGHWLQALPTADGAIGTGSDRNQLNSQWMIDDFLGYKLISSAAVPQILFSDGSSVKQGVVDAKQAVAEWTFEPVRGDAIYEAEYAFVGGGVQVAASSSSFTGSGYLDQFSAVGAKAIIAVNAQEAASYQAAVRYLNSSTTNQTLSLVVNGLSLSQLTLDAGSGWQEKEVTLPLRAGYNSVSFEHLAGDSGMVAIDRLTVHDSVNKAYRGAIETYTTYEAEHGQTNGQLIGPSRIYRDLAAEASGRQAVKLDQTGQYVQFQLAKKANSLVLRYSIPDSADGNGLEAKLGLYVNDVKVKDLDLTSKYAWEYGNYPWSNEPGQGSAHRFFDEIHTLIGNVEAGATIKLQKDSGNDASSYVIDFVEMEQAPEAYSQPSGFLSISDFGAAASDGLDDSQALKAAIAAAKLQHKGVWIPAGVFELANDNGGFIADDKKDGEEDTTKLFILDDVTIRGAGMWHTTLKGAKFFANGSHIGVYDLAIDGELNVRKDDAHTNAFEGAFGTGSTVQQVWIEHTKTGMWIARPQLSYGLNSDNFTNEFYVGGLRMRNLMADGINFSTNTKNSMVEQSHVRYAGDDGLAMWSTVIKGAYPDDYTDNNMFRYDTVQLPWLSNNMVVFGGKDNKMQDNILQDTIGLGGGIAVSTRFSPLTPFRGTTRVERNTLIRTGSRDAGLHANFGAIWVYADTKAIDSDVLIQDNIMLDNTYQGISIQGTSPVSNVTFKNNVIDGAGTNGFEVASTITGSVNVDNVIIRQARIQDVANSAGSNLTVVESGRGFSSIHPDQPTVPPVSSGGSGGGGGGLSATPNPTRISVADKWFTDAIADKQQAITISSGSTSEAVEFEISLAALLKLYSALPDAHVSLQHLNASYELPADIASLLSAEAKLLDPSQSRLKVRIEKVNETDLAAIKQAAAKQENELVGYPIRFELSLVNGDQTITLKQFGRIYVTRTITLDRVIDANTASAAIYHPETGEFQYVPAEFKAVNGQTEAAIHSTGNSIYTIIQHARTFGDLTGHWARKDIELLAAKHIVNGQTASSFAPDQSVTRAELAALLVRALGLSAGESVKADFRDVNSKDWYYSDIQTAAEYALINGYEDQSFKPDQTVTREEMALMVVRAGKLRPASGTETVSSGRLAAYTDAASISSWAQDAFAQVVSSGIIQGKSTSTLEPQALATRAESTVILHRLLQSMHLMN